jgi:hypothetical protein
MLLAQLRLENLESSVVSPFTVYVSHRLDMKSVEYDWIPAHLADWVQVLSE